MTSRAYQYSTYRNLECPYELFSFRYKVYVEELHRTTSYACHDTRTIRDGLDETAYQTIVTKDDEIIACIRLNHANEGSLQPYFDFYDLHEVPEEYQSNITICTLDMVAKPYRKKMVFVRMLQTAFDFSLRRGARFCYMDVNPPLEPLFTKLGLVKVKAKTHPDYGEVVIMRLDGRDYEKLLNELSIIRSPLTPLLKNFLDEQSVPELV